MDMLGQEMAGGGGGSRSKDTELAKAMFEGTQQYRRKLKMPDMNQAGEKIKEDVRNITMLIRPAHLTRVASCSIAGGGQVVS